MRPRLAHVPVLVLVLVASRGAAAQTSTATPAATSATAAPAPPTDPPRVAYNKALSALERADAAAAEAGFADARDRAGADADLRYRAAFNLAFALAARADGLEKDKPEEAAQALRTAAAWLRDAVRQRPEDRDARVNLEIVLRRIRVLADRLNKGKDGIEPRLDRLIADEGGLRDQTRALAAKVAASGAAAEPAPLAEEFRAASAWQRQLLGEAGTLAQMVADEAGKIEQKPEKERDDKERVRRVQLQNLEVFLEDGRQRMADARSVLGKLQAGTAHRKTDAAVRKLRRAKDQLADPVAVLRRAAADHAEVLSGARLLDLGSRPSITTSSAEAHAPPAWLTPEWLGDRESDVRERVDEVRRRFEAGVHHPGERKPLPDPLQPQALPEAASATARAGAAVPGGASKEDRDAARTIAAAREALPHLEAAEEALASAGAAVEAGRPADAAAPGALATREILSALELFSGTRALIELSYAEQSALAALLTPPGETRDPRIAAAIEQMPTEERARRVAEGVSRNADRLRRLEGLISEETADAAERAGHAPTGTAKEEAQREEQRGRLAEKERRAAADAVARMAAGLAQAAPPPLLPDAKEALARIEALRRLYFSLVEHLEDLAREEGDGREEAAGAATEKDAAERAKALGPVAHGEGRRAALAREIAKALEEQGREAAPAPSAPGGGVGTTAPSGQDAARKLAAAGEETTSAAKAMDEASTEASLPSAEVDPVLAAQKKALEHLATAIALLQPPQQDRQDQQQQQQQQQRQGEQEKQQQEKAVSREQAERRLQGVRDREAERRRDEQKRGQAPTEPVEKDW